MDNLDISDSLSSSFPWLPYGASPFDYQNGELGYFSQRSAMLEPIIEETSDDDDVSCGHVWTHNDNQWNSSESEADSSNSVIRVELIQEADTISERDFACPPKRRKQDENDEDVVLRKSTFSDDYKYRIDLLEPSNADAFTKRFCIDPVNFDRFSDPDSLSFNSLSRSSSLIQFESLERQIQTNGDTFGGSSPFLNTLTTSQETNSKNEFNTTRPNENTTNDTNTARNYYDIEKIDFNSALFLNRQEQTSSSESSYSTDNSIYYSDNQPDVDAIAKEKLQRTTHNAKMAFRSKNSVENLSEDSGYGEFPSIKCRSKSIPNLNQDQLIEEDEDLDNHRSLNNISNRTSTSKKASKTNGCIAVADSSKINTTHAETTVRSAEKVFGASKNSNRVRNDWNEHVLSAPTNTNGVSSKKSASSTSLQNTQSASLPDISSHFADDYDTNESIFFCETTNTNRKSKRNTVCGDLLSESASLLQKDSFSVASVPNNLNICSTSSAQCLSNGDFGGDVTHESWTSKNPRHTINNHWQEPLTTKTNANDSIASRNFDLARAFGVVDYQCTISPSPSSSSSSQQTFQQQKIINSSYSNLTLLDYSGSTYSIRNQLRAMAESQKRNSTSSTRSSNGSTTGSTEFSKCNFLLDEISAHFDKSLSILNDKGSFEDETDHVSHAVPEVKEIIPRETKPPQPPPRRQTKKTVSKNEREAKTDSALLEQSNYTFDRDPTNLKTCYTESLEQCNVDFQSSNSINLLEDDKPPIEFNPVKHSTPAKREMVASTPNLIQHRTDQVDTSEECLHSSSAYNSLNPLPQTDTPQTKGILSGAGSRNSLGKGVSFYPFVSQISWHEQSSAEDAAEPSDSEISDNRNKNYNDMSNSSSSKIQQPSTERTQPSDNVNNNTGLTNTVATSPTQTASTTPAIAIATATSMSTHTNETCDTNDSSAVDSSDDDFYYETQPRSLAALAERDRRREQLYLQKLAKKQQKEQQQQQCVNTSKDRNVLVDSQCRDGTSIQANAIDSSSAMIVNESRVSGENNNEVNRGLSGNDINRLCAQQQLKQQQQQQQKLNNKNKISVNLNKNDSFRSAVLGDNSKIDKIPTKTMEKSNVSAINVPVSQATGKSASLPPKMNNFDKKNNHKPGFLSRFTNFRFSLRGNSKKKLKTLENTVPPSNAANNIVLVSTKSVTSNNQQQTTGTAAVEQVSLRNKTNNNNSRPGCYQRNSMRSNEFEYIPLKDPIAVIFDTSNQTTSDKNVGNVTANSNTNAMKNVPKNFKNDNSKFIAAEKKNVLTSKPPLPRQPPRVDSSRGGCRIVGLCAKQPSTLNSTHPSYYQQQQQQQEQQHLPNNKAATLAQSNPQREGVKRHAQQQRSTSAPREINFNNTTDNGNHFHYMAHDDDYQLLSSRQANESHSRGGLLKGAVSSDGLLMDVNENSFCTGDEDETDDGKIGLIETNLDTDETVISGKTRSLMELGPQQMANRSCASAVNRRLGKHGTNGTDPTTIEPRRPHKSMEFLLDKENQRFVLPPENELQKSHDTNTNISEHQLRVQASLQRLNIPDWFKQYNSTAAKGGESTGGYVPGSFTKKRNADVQRWTGLSSKTTSLSSLGSHRSDRSPLLLSPSAQSHHGHTGFSRWSTSHLNSSQTSPSASTRGSFSRGGPNSSILSNQSYANNSSIRGSFRQPYLGWRSQEKLSQPRTPHERLASSMLSRQQTKQQQQQQQTQSNNTNSLSAKTATEPAVSPEIQTSIKEVTSAIVHYVNDQTNRTASGNSRSRSASPSSRHCWLESSFVGNKPMDSPQTPILESSIGLSAASSRVNGVESPLPVLSIQNDRPSHRGSATLEDVLASLLGLPSEYRSSGDTNTINDSCRLTIDAQTPRRHSESDAAKRPDSTTPDNNDSPAQLRRVSLDSTESKSAANAGVSSANVSIGETIKCRNPKCEATASPAEAKRNFKSCHNCTQMYCSRDCRRAHWEKHRKACLHSRVSVLCRQVLSACKDDNDTLSHLSILARRGYLTQGRGVVRILFRSPESAEVFVKQGFQKIGEATFVRWPELMPQEMGPELYSELLRLSTEYKPDSKMLIYVAICVVSEAPSSATSTSVKWERQLVSRCAKLKLSKTLPMELVGNNANSTANTGHQRTTSNTSNSASDPLATTSGIGIAEPTRVYTDVLILTFNMCDKSQNTQKNRELVLQNMQLALKKRGVNLRKHYPEIFQRLNSFVEGITDRFMPVTLHPRDSSTGQPFICIMMPNLGETDRIKLPESDKSDKGNIVTIDCLEVDQSTLID